MRCPICNKRVSGEENLQVHYLQDCKAVGDRRNSNEDPDISEDVEEMVEIDFRWNNTKGANEEKIYLISSLAGQILLNKNAADDIYESNKVIVPCGQHCCQLVIGDYCYPVIDIDVGSIQDSCYVILKEDVEGPGDEGAGARNVPDHASETDILSERYLSSEQKKGGPRHDKADPFYSRIRSEKSSDQNSGSVRESSELEYSSNENNVAGQQNDDLTKIATNSLHSVQIHSTHDDTQREQKTELCHQYDDNVDHDLAADMNLQQSRIQEASEADYPGNLMMEATDSQNGFNLESSRIYQCNNSRNPNRIQHGSSRLSSDTLTEQLAFQDSLTVNRKGDKKKLFEYDRSNDSSKKHDSCSYGEDVKSESAHSSRTSETNNGNLKTHEFKSWKSEPNGSYLKNEKITELYAKCASYETELERMKSENKELFEQLVYLREKAEHEERNQIIDLNERLNELRDENRSLREENESLKTGHRLQREDMDRINKALTDEIDDLSKKMENIKFGNRSFQTEEKAKIKELQEKVVDLTLENERLQRRLLRIHRETTSSQADFSGYGYIRRRSFEIDRNEFSDEFSHSRNTGHHLDYEKKSPPTKRRQYNDTSYPKQDESVIQGSPRFYGDDIYSPYHGSRFSGVRDRRETVSKTSKHDSKFDENSNILRNHDLTISHHKSASARYRDDSRVTSSAGPIKASHNINNDTSQLNTTPRYAKEHVDLDSILAPATLRTGKRERKTRRERPHSFHGGSTSASFFDSLSPESTNKRLSDNYTSSVMNDYNTGSYNKYKPSEYATMDTLSKESSVEHLKPFMPQSPSEISTGMKVLVTRSSGRIGKGLLKWKGHLPGHSEVFLGIELETPNGKNDGIFEDRRYFLCKKDHGIFAKFSKLVMAWGTKL